MKVRFTIEWSEEVSDVAIREWAENEGLLEEGEEAIIDDLRTQWLESRCDDYSQEPNRIPETMNIYCDVDISKE